MRISSILVFTLLATHWFTTFPASADTKKVEFGQDVVAEIYKTASGDALWIYRFQPQDHDPAIDRRPAVVFFFGGGWNGGSVRQFEKYARYLAHRGMVAFVADYRVKSRQGTPPVACVQDGKSAVRWIRTHASRLGIDPDRIAAAGGSAGGHVAAATGICEGFEDPDDKSGHVSPKADALLLFNPVYDNSPSGYGHDRVQEQFPAISPAHNITPDDPPTIVFLGSDDKLIPVETAQAFDTALRNAGVYSELYVYEGQSHGFFNETQSQRCCIDTFIRTDQFLNHLGWLEGKPDRSLIRELLEQAPPTPNIVFIMCDDLGYGDVQCLNPEFGQIKTPCIDSFAADGMTFTDAHSGSAVCTPTRYGLLTGRHCWRTRLQHGVVQGFAPCLITESRPTVATHLRSLGYQTAIIGKWHLNFEYQDPATGAFLEREKNSIPPVGALIPDGPVSRGFDYFHGFHHSRDMDAVIENNKVIEHDNSVNMLPRLARQSVGYIRKAADTKKPFFLYVPLSSPHTPIVPSAQWEGKSGLSPYADFVMQTDDVVGQIITAVDSCGISDHTLIVFTSDNGCSKAADIQQLAERGHRVSGPYRGSKADLWEGGHRIPFFMRWTGTIQPHTSSDNTVCITDMFATIADLLVSDVPPFAAEDSASFLPALYGDPVPDARNGLIHASISGHFGYRSSHWKLLLARGSGGWTAPKEAQAKKEKLPAFQLYDITADPGELHNLESEHRDIAEQLFRFLETDIHRGRSTEGSSSANDTDTIELWKSGKSVPAL